MSDPVGTAKAIPGGVARFAKGVARTAKGTADSVVANQKDAPADGRTTTDLMSRYGAEKTDENDKRVLEAGRELGFYEEEYKDSSGNITTWRAWGERTPAFAVDTVRDRCTGVSAAPCAVVMLNGDFREAEFLAWARRADGGNLGRMRMAMLRVRTDRR